MSTRIRIALSPAQAANPSEIRRAALEESGMTEDCSVLVLKRSIDARPRLPVVRLDVAITRPGETPPAAMQMQNYRYADPKKRVVIVGAGPAGYFAALQLLEHGITPIVLDRGKDVRARRRDLRAIQQFGVVHPHSNYCFGEGGAGTYSDGKLYTRSHKRGSIAKVLSILVNHGATSDILVDAHPHIGSNKLWFVVQAIRETILRYGGEVRFESHVVDLVMRSVGGRQETCGVVMQNGESVECDAVVLATGHSARDVFRMCVRNNVDIEAKPFALGVRIEHPQALIDQIQYRQLPRDPHLPASSYSLVCQARGKGVFSFCMCPGGLIVPSATAPGEIVVNGMSMSRRDSAFANSGTVVAVDEEDWKDFDRHGVLAAMEYQASVERNTFAANGDGSQRAPAQRLVDYLDGRVSLHLPPTSYIPGHVSIDLRSVLPQPINERLQVAIREFGKSMRGYLTNEAVMVAVESRTSSPVRIPRSADTFQHVRVGKLYPCGEGAGYAGGIVSAALDGQNVASAVARAVFAE